MTVLTIRRGAGHAGGKAILRKDVLRKEVALPRAPAWEAEGTEAARELPVSLTRFLDLRGGLQ